MNYRITAVIVAYNPDLDLLKRIIQLLQIQGCTVCVVNNSKFDLENIGPEVVILNLKENKGIAFAQNCGMQWAYVKNEADFVLQMDQDSIPSEDLIDSLILSWQILLDLKIKVGLIGSQDIDRDTHKKAEAKFNKGKKVPGTELIEVNEILSSGSLIPRSTFEQLGGPDAKLFIDLVDFEYCWRITNAGLLVIKSPQSKIFHKLGDGQVKILGFLEVGLPKPFRHYYSIRNTVYLILFGKAPLYWKATNSLKVLFKLIVYPITLPQGKDRLNFIWMGLRDGIFKRFQIINA